MSKVSERASDHELPEDEAPAWRRLLSAVFQQAWGLCAAYLGIGLGSELLRRLGFSAGTSIQQFLDGLPIFTMEKLGLLDVYLGAVAIGSLTPFWNRMLLSGVTLVLIMCQALLVAGLMALGWLALRSTSR